MGTVGRGIDRIGHSNKQVAIAMYSQLLHRLTPSTRVDYRSRRKLIQKKEKKTAALERTGDVGEADVEEDAAGAARGLRKQLQRLEACARHQRAVPLALQQS